MIGYGGPKQFSTHPPHFHPNPTFLAPKTNLTGLYFPPIPFYTKTKPNFYSKYCPQQSLPPLRFGSDTILPSLCSRNIGVVFDSTMSMLPHVNSFCKSAFYHLRNISRIRKLLSPKTTETLVHAFITSKLDHCNSLLYNVPNRLSQV